MPNGASRGSGKKPTRRAPVKDDSSRYMRRSAALPRLGETAEHDVIRDMEHLRRARDA
jgi:hypothetical protein